ncbi:MAG: 1-(5-phosphoribosyl)-5-((5-phosphoribosylamino)methylideneamino)imidazole-4-carboxamide isomerase [Proteobacteria bacterium]|nr:MAG: 1-(5-phosphoribosyl)-5-((5-phosphoribosylamino)methylideneamino)imidazole-4-carboxamide isomerase [Pseudomonadota bacterium]
MSAPQPSEIILHQASRVLELNYSDGSSLRLPWEFLRVYSPSAEVRGHGPGQEHLQSGKKDVQITAIDPVGTYAVRLVFSDGHDTGLYSWEYLYHLGTHQDRLWQDYLQRLLEAGCCREPTGAASASPAPTSWKKL